MSNSSWARGRTASAAASAWWRTSTSKRAAESESWLAELQQLLRDLADQAASARQRSEVTAGRVEEQASRADFLHLLLGEERGVP